jgi:hypothetical protein
MVVLCCLGVVVPCLHCVAWCCTVAGLVSCLCLALRCFLCVSCVFVWVCGLHARVGLPRGSWHHLGSCCVHCFLAPLFSSVLSLPTVKGLVGGILLDALRCAPVCSGLSFWRVGGGVPVAVALAGAAWLRCLPRLDPLHCDFVVVWRPCATRAFSAMLFLLL